MPTNPPINKYRLLDKMRKAGYTDDKSILNINETIIDAKELTRVELQYALQIRDALKQRRIIEYLASPYLELNPPKEKQAEKK